MFRMCDVYLGCNIVQMNIPQKVIVVESRKCDATPQNTPFNFKEPLKRVTMSKYPQLTNIPFFVWYQMWVLEPLLLCAYYPQS